MQLSYGQLETVLAAHLRIHPDKIGTFRSRIKQLQRLQFPPGVNVGRGAKMAYSGEHLLQLATAFEFIGIGLPAQLSCALVEKHWSAFAAGFALSAIQDRSFGNDTKTPIFACMELNSLHEIQFSNGLKMARPSGIKITDEYYAQSFLTNVYEPSYSRFLISVSQLLNNILEIARNNAGVKTSAFDGEFNPWLPDQANSWVRFKDRYPDRSNIPQRREIHRMHGTDPDSLTPDGAEEAREFIENGFQDGPPF